MARTAIRRRELITSHPEVVCEICERRLLRGEQPASFVAEGRSMQVCELCVDRARQAGWVRASEIDATARDSYKRHPRSRTLMERLRRRRAGSERPSNRSTRSAA
jgi:ribosome-binding protein aMBF1 (putative translation factor)